MDEYAAPDSKSEVVREPLTVAPIVLTILCLLLGIIGTLLTCTSFASTAWSYAAPGFMPPEQAAMMESVRAEQGWWVLPFTILQLIAKMVLSVGLIVGGGAVLARASWGASVFRPVLLFGIAFEMLVGLFGAAYTAFNFSKMGEDFGDIMSTDPNIPPELAELMGEYFGLAMAVAMVFMLGWALVKVGLYAATAYSLPAVREAD